MKQSKINRQTADEVEIIFYEAFMHCDIEVMAAIWADDDVVCVHPGTSAITGYDAVMRSWQHILEDAAHMDIRYSIKNKMVTDDFVVHVVVEEMFNNNRVAAIVVATNIYKKYLHGWLLTEHHGSVVNSERKGQTLQ